MYAVWKITSIVKSRLPEFLKHQRDDPTQALVAPGLQHEHAVLGTPLRQPFVTKEGRPNISDIVMQMSQIGMPLSVHACGPSSMLDAVRTSVSKANTTGRKVT